MLTQRFLILIFLSLFCLQQSNAQHNEPSYSLADTTSARMLVEEAKNLINQGDYPTAAIKANEAKAIYEQTLGENSLEIANALFQLGRSKYLQGFLEEALSINQKVLRIRKDKLTEDHPAIAYAYNNLAIIYVDKGDYEQGFLFHQKALDIRLQAFGEAHEKVAASYQNLGVINWCTGNYKKALSYHKKVIEILEPLDSYHPNLALGYNSLGIVYHDMGNYNPAIKAYEKAYQIWLKTDHPYLSNSYNNLGTIHYDKGDYANAIIFFQKAMSIQKEIAPEHWHLASIYNNLGLIYNEMGAYDKAMAFGQKALYIRLKTLEANHPNIAESYNFIGNLYDNRKEYEKAMLFYKKALQLGLKKLGKNHPFIAMVYNNSGNIYNHIGNYDKAIAFYEKSFRIELEASGAMHPRVASSYLNLGSVYQEQKNYIAAIDFYQKSLHIWTEQFGAKHPDVALPYHNLGEVYYLNKDFVLSTLHYQKALAANNFQASAFNEIVSPLWVLNSLKAITQVNKVQFEQTKDQTFLNQAYDYVLQSLEFIAYLQSNHTTNHKTILQNEFPAIFEQAIEMTNLKAELEKDATLKKDSYTYFEKSKATVLRKHLQESTAFRFAKLPDSLLQKETELRIELTYLDKKRQEQVYEGKTLSDTSILQINNQRFELQEDYQALKKQFEKNYPDYYRLKYDLSTTSLKEVQNNLIQPNQTLLEYFVGDSSIFVFIIQKDTYYFAKIKKDFPLNDWIKQLQNGLYGYYNQPTAAQTDELYSQTRQDYIEAAQNLYQKLIAPIKEKLSTKELIIIPDGVLGYVPFGVLLSRQPIRKNNWRSYPFLEKEFQISYCYSATLLQEMQEKQHSKQATQSLIAFAPFYEGTYSKLDSTFQIQFDTLSEAEDTVLLSVRVNRKDFNPLPASGEEVKTITQLWQGDYYLNEDATEDRFNEIAGNYRMVHLSTHGVADSRVGDYSYLAFAEQADSLENEYLYVRDLYNLQLNADLVVLSACEAGVGELQKGEGIISLARAFAYAGAKSIVTTLWVVNDSATKDLMREFYVQLRNQQTKDAALRQAKLSLLDSRQFAHPFFWAGFVPVGDMSGIK